MSKCGACTTKLNRGDTSMRCYQCQSSYHILCIGINSELHKTMSSAMLKTWSCPECVSKRKKGGDNTHTPVKNISPEAVDNRILEAISVGGSLGCSTGQTPTEQHSAILKVVAARLLQICDQLQVLSGLQPNIQSIQNELSDIKDNLSKKMEDMSDQISKMESELKQIKAESKEKNNALERTIDNFKQDINDRDQFYLMNDVEITGIPEQKPENILHLVSLVATKVGMNLDERDVVFAYRAGVRRGNGDARSRPICVRLARKTVRDELLKSARVRRGITTADLNLPGDAHVLYINERMTQYNRQLFRKTREAGREKNWKFIWTREGKIYARQREGMVAHRIRNEQNINSLFDLTINE